MSSNAIEMTFRSNRSDTAPLESVQPEAERSSVLVISQTKGMTEMVGRAMGIEDNVQVWVDSRPLTQVARDDSLDLSGCDIIVFEAHAGDDVEMKALSDLAARTKPETRFLAMTFDPITLAYAKELMALGVDEVLPITSVRPELRHAVEIEQQVAVEVARRGGELRNGAIVAVSQTRGGIGATALSLNMAYTLSAPKRGKNAAAPARVAVIDLDFQNGNLGASVDVEDNGAFLDLLKTREQPDDVFVQNALVSYKDRFDILAAPVEFAPLDSMTPEMMALLLGELRLAYDYVILDLPRALVNWIEPILARADQMLIVTDTSVASIRQARRLIDLFTEEHVGLPVEIVVSMEKKPFSLSDSLKEAVKFLERPLNNWIPRDDVKARKAADRGQPMLEVSRRSLVAKPVVKLAGQISAIQANSSRREA